MNSLYHAWGFSCGFPHSEISGSLAMCAYPKLIAAYHVLHRLLMPRHSPCALCSLTYIIFQNLWFCWKLILLNFSSWSFNSQRIYSWLCCILYTFIYVQFSKNILKELSLSKLNRFIIIVTIQVSCIFYPNLLFGWKIVLLSSADEVSFFMYLLIKHHAD